ncbi:MAG: UDP-N-acetylmuramoyl-L-alanyl-D-glutamate--2,6-diaminopimelate ligase [bacterium]|nr:UDP-N-acetylmuramoyl-L-alanyl-D-glutamate--2,6-diaminopimelate ligase [bacterium]
MLSLAELAREVDGKLFASNPALPVENVVYDSRKVRPGDAFVAISGLKDNGFRYVQSAIEHGAACIISETRSIGTSTSSEIVVTNARAALAKAAWALAGKPQQELCLIGVTGTNGKTTVTAALAQLLSRCGHPTGVCGTLGMLFDQLVFESDRTTAEAPELAQAFASMREAGCTHVALEATSIGLVMHRLDELVFDAAVFTNLSRDHLDFHGSWEAYRDAKLTLFNKDRLSGPAVVNADDPEHCHFVERANRRALTFAIDANADFRATNLALRSDGTAFDLATPDGQFQVDCSLIGRFNVHNVLAIVTTAYALGLPLATIAQNLPFLRPVRGRAEVVSSVAPFSVIVDYAHTPDALVKILSTMRSLVRGRLLCLIGAEVIAIRASDL